MPVKQLLKNSRCVFYRKDRNGNMVDLIHPFTSLVDHLSHLKKRARIKKGAFVAKNLRLQGCDMSQKMMKFMVLLMISLLLISSLLAGAATFL
ncbi:stressosome-associated protein Prli42 [Bacillus sp. FSL K6-3312]|uniref:stressosome-associated protein Prli42 n=1 Tax=Bacillus TaxID=1386 RepID=UPI00283AB56B|nr:stressosome-associated protein Prli42 [Bacillus pumilus]